MVARDRIELPTRGFSGPWTTLQPSRNAGCSSFKMWHNSHLRIGEPMNAQKSGTKLAHGGKPDPYMNTRNLTYSLKLENILVQLGQLYLYISRK